MALASLCLLSAGVATAAGADVDVGVGTGYDSNPARTGSGARGSFLVRARAGAAVERRLGDHRAALGYRVEVARHAGAATEDFDDHRAHGAATVGLRRQLRLGLAGSWAAGHDGRGEPATRLAAQESLDRWHETTAAIGLGLGPPRAGAAALVRGERRERTYTNNGQGGRDHAATRLATVLRIGLGGGRDGEGPGLTLAASLERLDYRAGAGGDGHRGRLLVGLSRITDASERACATVQLGAEQRRHDDARNEAVQPTWRAGLAWQPDATTRIEMQAEQRGRESTLTDAPSARAQGGATLRSRRAAVRWSRRRERLAWEATLGYGRDVFRVGRRDHSVAARLEARYRLDRDIEVAASVAGAARRSTLRAATHEALLGMLIVRWRAPSPHSERRAATSAPWPAADAREARAGWLERGLVGYGSCGNMARHG